MNQRRYRSRAIADKRIPGFGISYQRENLLARGLGLEHLRELLIRLVAAASAAGRQHRLWRVLEGA